MQARTGPCPSRIKSSASESYPVWVGREEKNDEKAVWGGGCKTTEA